MPFSLFISSYSVVHAQSWSKRALPDDPYLFISLFIPIYVISTLRKLKHVVIICNVNSEIIIREYGGLW